MPIVEQAQVLAGLVSEGVMDEATAAVMLVETSGGGLTDYCARDMLDNWRRYQRGYPPKGWGVRDPG
jgi:hypothetical protein